MLTDSAVRRLKPADRPFKTSDSAGLYLLVTPQGSKLWRMNYRLEGRQKTLSFGAYPQVSLAEARAARDAAKARIAAGEEPKGKRKKREPVTGETFAEVADEYRAEREAEGVAPRTLAKVDWLLAFLRADLGDKNLEAITAAEILEALRKRERQGHFDTVKRMRSLISRVFRYGIATGRATRDPAADLRGALVSRAHKHHAAILKPKPFGDMLRAIDGYSAPIVRAGLQLLALTFLRPGELRGGRWEDIEGDVWRVPAQRMKSKREHLVPLSRQALERLDELRATTGGGELMFPGARSAARPISDNTLNAALRTLGFDSETHVAHGFRRSASTMLNELGWNRDWIERQLAHVEGNRVRATYNAAEYLGDRRRMMQAWADHLDEWKGGLGT